MAEGELLSLTPQGAVAAGAESLRVFGKLFFPKTFRQDSPLFHEEIGGALYQPSRYNAFEVFRGGAKTSLLRVFAAQRISYALSRTIMYVSVSQQHAVFSVRWLKRQVQYNTRWAQLFGLRKGEKWSDEIIEIYHGVDETPITVMAMGITGQIRGFNVDDFRPDLIIADDILNEENTATPEQRKKLSDLFFGALQNSLAPASECPTAKMVLLQTPLHREDLIETCMQDPTWNARRFSAFNEHGESRWPERWTTEVLKAEKESFIRRGLYSLWMREMECTIVAGAGKTFDVTKLQYWDVLPEGMRCIVAIDPASSESKKADDNVVIAVGFKGLDVFVIAYHADTGVMPDACAAHFFDLVMLCNPVKAAVEGVAYQRVLKWYIDQEMIRRRMFVPVELVQDRRAKSDRIIQALAGLVAYGHLHIHSSMSKLMQQLDDFDSTTDQHDDVIDALAIAIMSMNPALRLSTNDGEIFEDDEDEYEELSFGGCP
jgi:hypothetical protein